MIHKCLALLAALLILPSTGRAEVFPRYQNGVIQIVSDGSICTGFTFGGSVVVTTSGCVFDDGARAPSSDISVISGMHNHGSTAGPDPKPHDRWFVTGVHIDPVLLDAIRDRGYSTDLPNSGTPVFLQIHSHTGARDFDAVNLGPRIHLFDGVDTLARTGATRRFGLLGYPPRGERRSAIHRSTCTGLERRGALFGIDCDTLGITGGPVFDRDTGKVIGLSAGKFTSDGATAVMPMPERYRSDIAAMLDGQKGGFFELRTIDISPTYFIGIEVWNRCSDTVNVIVHFKDAETDDWVTRGAYVIGPGELGILPAETRNRVIYWTAYKDGADYYAWRGDHDVRDNGNTLEMIREDAGSNWNDIRLQPSC